MKPRLYLLLVVVLAVALLAGCAQEDPVSKSERVAQLVSDFNNDAFAEIGRNLSTSANQYANATGDSTTVVDYWETLFGTARQLTQSIQTNEANYVVAVFTNGATVNTYYLEMVEEDDGWVIIEIRQNNASGTVLFN